MEDIILAIIGALLALCTGIINTLFKAWVKDDALDAKKITVGAGSVVLIIVGLFLFINLYLGQAEMARPVAVMDEPAEEAPAAEEQEPTEAEASDTETVIAETPTSSPTSPMPTATLTPASTSQPSMLMTILPALVIIIVCIYIISIIRFMVRRSRG